MKQHIIGFQELDNKHLNYLSEQVISIIEKRREELYTDWKEYNLKQLNKRNIFQKYIKFLDFEDYTIEDIDGIAFDWSNPEYWIKQDCLNWEQSALSIAENVFKATQLNIEGKTLINIENYVKMNNIIEEYK